MRRIYIALKLKNETKILNILFHFFLFISSTSMFGSAVGMGGADLIIFSYDRPMQLYALLESIEKYLSGIEETVVIYRTSNERYENGYKTLQSDFPQVRFAKQKKAPNDFKSLVMQELAAGKASYALFAVDDNIVKNYADLSECASLMEKTGAYGFYLRLGVHVNANYPDGKGLALPFLQEIEPNIYSWVFNSYTELGDWKYPHTVDMTLYRKSDIQRNLQLIAFRGPNTLEGNWVGLADVTIMNRKGLCYNNSIVINIPTNKVQNECQTLYMHTWSPESLLGLFESGLKIDISPFYGIKNNMCHSNYEIQFISKIKNKLVG